VIEVQCIYDLIVSDQLCWTL